MKPSSSPGPTRSLMAGLKEATSEAHLGLESAPFFRTLAAGEIPVESYVGYLRALAVIHAVLDPALEASPDPRISAVWTTDMAKLTWLRQDLHFFEPRTVPDLVEAAEAAIRCDGRIRLASLEQPLSLLGWAYVLEGSTLGATLLRPLVARALLLTDDGGMAYLQNYGASVHERWGAFGQRMNALELDAESCHVVTQAAVDAFNHIEAIIRALCPFSPESRTFLATSINHEAGSHAVPADPREVAASLRAGDRCWEKFPYFEQRYGERGRRFARSDAAWQATLCELTPVEILQQVRWLGRLLASRGMPTLLLQVQLEMLVEELAEAVPDRRQDFEKLLPGAADLRDGRRRSISDHDLAELSASFDRAVGPEWSARFPDTGALLASAVADVRNGIPKAIGSLRSWLTDAGRFPPVWIEAVDATLAEAESRVSR